MAIGIIIVVFVGVAALVGGVALFLQGERTSSTEERLEILTGVRKVESAVDSSELNLLSSPLDESRGLFDRMLEPLVGFQTALKQANSPFSASQLLAISVVLAVAGMGFVLVAGWHWALAVGVGTLSSVSPLGWLWFRRRQRLAQFGRQLPEALELVGRALRAGHSLALGISLVAEEMPEPISGEFRRCYEEQNLGIPMEESLDEMTERVPNLDLKFFVTAVILQRQTGGDLAEILDKIGRLIRERFRIWGQIQSLTGEGRLSGIVLLALPPVLFIVMLKLNPEYVMMLFDNPMGQQMLAGALVLQVLGAIVIKKIITIKV